MSPATPATLDQALARAALSQAGLRFVDRRERAEWLGWSELAARATEVGRRLAAHGVERGDRVALVYPTGPGFFEAFVVQVPPTYQNLLHVPAYAALAVPWVEFAAGRVLEDVLDLVPPHPELAIQEARAHEGHGRRCLGRGPRSSESRPCDANFPLPSGA